MNFIKKFAKEISVFGLVLVVFLGLWAYRTATYATYSTLTTDQVKSKIKAKDTFVLVAGSSSDSTTTSYQEVLTTYQTKHRSPKIYYVDTKSASSNWIHNTLGVDVVTPATFIIKNGKVTANKTGSIQYYYLKDFIDENY